MLTIGQLKAMLDGMMDTNENLTEDSPVCLAVTKVMVDEDDEENPYSHDTFTQWATAIGDEQLMVPTGKHGIPLPRTVLVIQGIQPLPRHEQ